MPFRADTLAIVEKAVRQRLSGEERPPLVLGICGAQGSGKSTLATGLAEIFEADSISTAILSIDDLYKTRAEREVLANGVHPLLRTRGVPGTHDVTLGLNILNDLVDGRPAELPRFDKARDDREPAERWAAAAPDVRLLIFEGWCVGARPESEIALSEPINPLERDEDPDGRWRAFVNGALSEQYQILFARIDMLILLAAPDFPIVRKWRIEQEHDLRKRADAGSTGIMTDTQVERFIQHYERLTRHILAEMPGRADLVVRLNEKRRPIAS